ncbi:MAG: MFS transporter [Sandaracinaceae bacterium]
MARERINVASYLASRLCGNVGFQAQSVAVGWQVYTATNDPLDLGWVGLSIFVPMVLLSPYAGTLADRYDRRTILWICHALYAVGAAALTWLSVRGETSVLGILLVLGFLGAVRAFAAPASWALLPWLVAPERLARAIPLSSTTFQIAMIGGPALGGFLYAAGGAPLAYGFAAAMNVLAAAFVIALRFAVPIRAAITETAWQRALGGLAFLRSRPALLGAISLDLVAVLLGGAVALMPVYAHDILHVDETGLGFLRAAPSVGAALVAVFLAIRPIERHAGRLMFVAVAVYGLATIVFAVSEDLAMSLVALAVLGAADMISVVIRQSIIQLRTPDELRGRVAALNLIFIGASNELGEFESGVTASLLGTVRAALLGGIGTLIATGVWAAWFKELREIDSLED